MYDNDQFFKVSTAFFRDVITQEEYPHIVLKIETNNMLKYVGSGLFFRPMLSLFLFVFYIFWALKFSTMFTDK